MASARQRIWGWFFFDWASQPYNTLLLTFIFGPYFAEVARGYYMGACVTERDLPRMLGLYRRGKLPVDKL